MIEPTHKFHPAIRAVEANGITINVAMSGTGPAVLLLRGWPHTWQLWHSVFPLLAVDHCVIAPDLRGIGGTTQTNDGYDLHTLADDAAGLLDALGIEQASVVGIDLSVPIATMLALRYPDRIRRLIVTEGLVGKLPGAEVFLANGAPWWFGFHGVPGLAEAVMEGHADRYIDWFLTTGTADRKGIAPATRDAFVAAYKTREQLRGGFGALRAASLSGQCLGRREHCRIGWIGQCGQLPGPGQHYGSVGAAVGAVDEALGSMSVQIGNLTSRVDSLGQVQGGSVAVGGSGASATVGAGTDAVAVGSGAAAQGDNGMALGEESLAAGPNDTALDGNAKVHADGSTAVGANATITAQVTNAVAVGESASVSAPSGTALGQGASVTAENAVALGRNASATRANTVSVGSLGAERQVTNVADGTAATDAVNVRQMQAGDATTLESARRYADSLQSKTDDRFHEIDQRVDRMGAVSAAYAGMAINTAGLEGTNRVGVGVGSQGGESALAVGYQRLIGRRASVSLGGAFSGEDKSVSAGAGFSW